MTKNWRRRSTYTKANFRPYTRAIGEFALAWNDFHEALGDLFVHAVAGSSKGLGLQSQLSGIWGAITNDRQKRDVLLIAMERIGRRRHEATPTIAKEVAWLVERGTSLENGRNNVIHSPLSQMLNALVAGLQGVQLGDVVPGVRHHNLRAEKLSTSLEKSGRKLLQEIRFYRDYATALAVYARALDYAWEADDTFWKRPPWPERPALPRLTDRN